jgi:hypothetical protein
MSLAGIEKCGKGKDYYQPFNLNFFTGGLSCAEN